MMYYTIRGFNGEFYGQFEDRIAAEDYANREIGDGWDVFLVDHQFLLQCLIDILSWYIKEDYKDINVAASVKNTLAELERVFGLSQVLPNEPTEDPLYQPAIITDKDLEVQKEADKVALARWGKKKIPT